MGIEGIYEITLKSQLGPKNGIFRVRQFKREIFVTFELLGRENKLIGREKEGHFEIKGGIMTPLGLKECKVWGTLISGKIEAEIIIGSKEYPIIGEKLENVLKGEKE